MKFSFTHLSDFVFITPDSSKLHADYSVVILTAPLTVFTESYRSVRVNQAKELLLVRA